MRNTITGYARSAPTTIELIRRSPALSIAVAALALCLLNAWLFAGDAAGWGAVAKLAPALESTLLLIAARIVFGTSFPGVFLSAAAYLFVTLSAKILLPGISAGLPVEVLGLAWLLLLSFRFERGSWHLGLALLAGAVTAHPLAKHPSVVSLFLVSGVSTGVACAWMAHKIRVPSSRKAFVDLASLTAIALEWLVIALAIKLAFDFPSALVWLASAVVIGSRLHALFILYHDAVHGLLSPVRRVNDFLINLLVGIPLLMPVHLYRRFHISHHAHTGKAADPERILLFAGQSWNYRPLPLGKLILQLLGDLFFVNMLRMGWKFYRESRDPHSFLKLRKERVYPELFLAIALWIAFLWFLSRQVGGETLGAGLALFFGSYLTVMNLIQKIRSYVEHSIGENAVTNSWHPGLLGRLSIWPYHINYHKEHHRYPHIKWHQLPASFPSQGFRDTSLVIPEIWEGAPGRYQSARSRTAQNHMKEMEK